MSHETEAARLDALVNAYRRTGAPPHLHTRIGALARAAGHGSPRRRWRLARWGFATALGCALIVLGVGLPHLLAQRGTGAGPHAGTAPRYPSLSMAPATLDRLSLRAPGLGALPGKSPSLGDLRLKRPRVRPGADPDARSANHPPPGDRHV